MCDIASNRYAMEQLSGVSKWYAVTIYWEQCGELEWKEFEGGFEGYDLLGETVEFEAEANSI